VSGLHEPILQLASSQRILLLQWDFTTNEGGAGQRHERLVAAVCVVVTLRFALVDLVAAGGSGRNGNHDGGGSEEELGKLHGEGL